MTFFLFGVLPEVGALKTLLRRLSSIMLLSIASSNDLTTGDFVLLLVIEVRETRII